MTHPLLRLEQLAIWLPSARGPVLVVAGVDLELLESEAIGIVGESGSGKTLTALSLLGLLPTGSLTSGRVLFGGRNVLGMRRKELARMRGGDVAMIFQDPTAALHPMLTIEEQLTEHMKPHLGLKGPAARERARDLLERVRIPDPEIALRVHAHQLSGGMRQRVAIAMALACRPRLVIADEPTTALDVTVQAGILELLEGLRAQEGLAILLISHDVGVVASLTERVYVMYGGRVVETGPTATVLTEPRHPYTQALLAARPDPNDRSRQLLAIPGAPPIPGLMPTGCVFHPRCPLAIDNCRLEAPRLQLVAADRLSRCPVTAPNAAALDAKGART
jgi:oligopeptide/dipeptide ABC transporter ATP-binding protein